MCSSLIVRRNGVCSVDLSSMSVDVSSKWCFSMSVRHIVVVVRWFFMEMVVLPVHLNRHECSFHGSFVEIVVCFFDISSNWCLCSLMLRRMLVFFDSSSSL